MLKSIGIVGEDVDPCLYMKRDKNGLIYVVLYVYDNLIIGNDKPTNKTIKALKRASLVFKVYDSLEYYLSCEINPWIENQHGWDNPILSRILKRSLMIKLRSYEDTRLQAHQVSIWCVTQTLKMFWTRECTRTTDQVLTCYYG